MAFDIQKLEGYDNQKIVLCVHDNKVGLEGYISIHRGNLKFPSFGATRIWSYGTSEEALVDSLKLSKLMSYKAAMAGLPCGGAKAALVLTDGVRLNKSAVLQAYANRVNYLGGHFITGADVGVDEKDVKHMRRTSPYIVGVKVDPVKYTGLGILYSIQSCVKEVFGSESAKGRSFAIQGLGKVGAELIKLIYDEAKIIYVNDVDENKITAMRSLYPKIIPVSNKDIFSKEVDVFSPCALSNCLNSETLEKLKCSIIAGGANCQLENEQIGESLFKKNILYAPDYVVNAGGLISVFDEYQFGNTNHVRVLKRIKRIKLTMNKLISASKKEKKSVVELSNRKAESIFNNYN